MRFNKAELTENAVKVLERRYLVKDEAGSVTETPDGLFRRVADFAAGADRMYDGSESVEERADVYYGMMSSLSFLPNTPTLMNAGTRMGQLSACFVIPVEDSIEGIFGAVLTMARIHQSGGGTGFSFSRLRPKDDMVRSTGGVASGPVSFMKVFDQATEVVKQGGRRRGANMGILRVDHPDIMEFIHCKDSPGEMVNFNLSVAVTDAFMEALGGGGKYPLVNPRTGKRAGTISAAEVWEAMARAAWLSGDPGVIFIDRVNALQPTPEAGYIEATNPCGEQPLLPYESCNLGSINLKNVVEDGRTDWERLGYLVREGVRFLDNIIDLNSYPVPQIKEMTLANRKIGLGVMGFADMLIKLGVPYDSDDALKVAEDVMGFIHKEAVAASAELGRTRGSFSNFGASTWKLMGLDAMRNATVTTVAPTGTIGIIAGASSGIEPLFAVAYVREVMEDARLREVNSLFIDTARRRGFYTEGLIDELSESGSLKGIKGVPEDVKRLFPTALEIEPRRHVMMQASFQRHTDNAVSKTVNMPNSATYPDVSGIYSLAYEAGCKGVTVFRDGSRPTQVLRLIGSPDTTVRGGPVEVGGEYTGECKLCSV